MRAQVSVCACYTDFSRKVFQGSKIDFCIYTMPVYVCMYIGSIPPHAPISPPFHRRPPGTTVYRGREELRKSWGLIVKREKKTIITGDELK